MKRIVEQHLARLRRAQADPTELDALRDRLFAELYPDASTDVKPVRYERIPADAPDWFFESELRRSGVWAMMERCYPTPQAQCQ